MTGLAGRDLCLELSPKDPFFGEESVMPKMLIHLPLRDDVEAVCATAIGWTAMASGMRFVRGWVEDGPCGENGRDGDRVIGREEGPAVSTSNSAWTLACCACSRIDAVVWTGFGIGSVGSASRERERRFLDFERDRERFKKFAIYERVAKMLLNCGRLTVIERRLTLAPSPLPRLSSCVCSA